MKTMKVRRELLEAVYLRLSVDALMYSTPEELKEIPLSLELEELLKDT